MNQHCNPAKQAALIVRRARFGIRALSILTGFSALSLPIQNLKAEYWATSKLTRFGVEFSYPSSFRRLKAVWEQPGFQGSISAGNADTITDGAMTVKLEGTPVMDRDFFESSWANDSDSLGAHVSYQVKKSNWYVLSGAKPRGVTFYRKVWRLPHGFGFIFDAFYPEELGATYDPILERMLKGFTPVFTDG